MISYQSLLLSTIVLNDKHLKKALMIVIPREFLVLGNCVLTDNWSG